MTYAKDAVDNETIQPHCNRNLLQKKYSSIIFGTHKSSMEIMHHLKAIEKSCTCQSPMKLGLVTPSGFQIKIHGARWRDGSASDSRARVWGFKTYLHCVVSLSKIHLISDSIG